MDRDVEVRTIDGEDRAWLADVVKKADGGDPAALADLRKFLAENPLIYRQAGNLAAPLEAAWIDHIAGGNRLIAESVKLETARFREELLGDRPGELVRMLVNQVIVNHLELQAHQRCASESANATEGRKTTILKRRNRAQKRLGYAVKTLESVQRLLPKDESVKRAAVPKKKAAGRARGSAVVDGGSSQG